jgi:hypothetical protein
MGRRRNIPAPFVRPATEFHAARRLNDTPDSRRSRILRSTSLIMSLALAGVLAGCNGIEVLGSARQDSAAAGNEIVVDGIRAVLVLEPSDVQRTHPFTARLTLTNTLAQPATWTSGMGCLAFLNVYHDNRRIPLRGTDFACLAVVTARVLGPGESLSVTWDLVAQTTDGTPLRTGRYIFEADPVLRNRLTLQHRLVIR